jgi:predicted ATPase/class 3 adenylate cyclase/Tfp pilus assembly protein PilF
MAALPTGTVTFLFTDIQGSTRLLHELQERYAEVLAEHRRALRAAFTAHAGVEVGTEGDSFFVAFTRASDAVAAVVDGQRALLGGPVRVRMGLHTGEPMLTAEGYVGMVVHRAARIMSVGHGGQVLLSEAVATLVAGRLPPDVSLRDLGSVRLKDLSSPEHLYQIVHPQLQADFPPLRSLEATPNNLPQQVTSFVGRRKEVAETEAMLGNSRMLTFTGPGGSGKTRLCLQVAADLLDQFADGAWLVELAPLTEPNLVPQTVATALGVKEVQGKSITQALIEHLERRHLLLILDNCEHLIDACAKIADALMRHCPQVKILASSREALGIAGEHTYRVPSLTLPDRKAAQTPQMLSTYESVQLFIDRALLVRADFVVTNKNAPALASLCSHLDGIPFAIELAAARVRSLSLEEIESKLDQRFRLLTGGSRTALPRQQTLRSLIDWSYDLLKEPEQLLLQRLSVFAGRWTLDAAEKICAGDGVEDWEVLDLLTSLSDKSLVVAEQADELSRYALLETMRQYAREKLAKGADVDTVRRRHLDYFLALAEAAEPKLMSAEQVAWLQRLENEHDNLRAALDATLVDESAEAGLRLCGALQRFWWIRGHFSEGREWCRRALAKVGAAEPTAARAKVLSGAGVLAYFQCDYPDARARHNEALTIRRQLSDRRGTAISLTNLGNVTYQEGDFASARSLFDEALAIMRELGDRPGIAALLNNLGDVAINQGDYATAQGLLEECLAITRELGGDGAIIAGSLSNLGDVATHRGDFPAAQKLFEESLAIRRELGDRSGIAYSLGSLANLAGDQGEPSSARPLFEEALAILRELGDSRGIASLLEGLSAVSAAEGDLLRAARVWSAAEKLRAKIGSPMAPNERPRYERNVATARKALADDGAFEKAWREGGALTLEQAVEIALGEG